MQATERSTTSTELPRARRRRRRWDWARALSRTACVLFALVGTVPFVVLFVVRSSWARDWAAREVGAAAAREHLELKASVGLRAWPLAVELSDVRLDSTDHGAPAFESKYVRVRPRFFALLSGKLAIDQVEVDRPRVRLVVKDGLIKNLGDRKLLPDQPAKSAEPFDVPFNVLALTDADVDATYDDVHAIAHNIDLDVTAEHDRNSGASLEIQTRIDDAAIHHARTSEGKVYVDDDALCALEARVRVENGGSAILVRRFDAAGSADLDAAEGTTPKCDLPATDKRRIELSLSHVHVAMPPSGSDEKKPRVDGHVKARAPLGLVSRLVELKETQWGPFVDGWAGLELDVRYAPRETEIPDLGGTLEAHDVRVSQFGFAQELHSEVLVRRNVITSPMTTVRLGDGIIAVTDAVVDPFYNNKQGKLTAKGIEIRDVNFSTLLKNLGIHPHTHVAWDLHEIQTREVTGTFSPLKIDFDFVGKTYNFGVYDRPADDPSRGRIVGVTEALCNAHLAVRDDGVRFQNARAQTPHSLLEGGLVFLGFHDDLRVDVPQATVDLDDLSPIGPAKMSGVVKAEVHVGGNFHTPTPEGEIKSITNFAVSDIGFGSLSAGKVKVDVHKPEVEITGVKATRGKSDYEVPTARLDFGGGKGFRVDAQTVTQAFDLRDLLGVFKMDDDPRFAELFATLGARADVHVAVGGPEDKCGGGYVAVRAKSHLSQVKLFGEAFPSGDADFELAWEDRQRGIAGADIDVRSFVLSKGKAGRGTVLGSASIRRGGALNGHVVVDGMPLTQITSLGDHGQDLEGTVAAVAQVTGDLDDFHDNAGIVITTQVDVSPTRFRRVPLGASHLQVLVTQKMPKQTNRRGMTGCHAPYGPPYDRTADNNDLSSHGDYVLDGDLFDERVHVEGLKMTRQKFPFVSGKVAGKGCDVGTAMRIANPPKRADGQNAAPEIGGQLSGDLTIASLPIHDLAHAKLSFDLKPTTLSRAGQKVTIPHPDQPFVVENNTLTLPKGLKLQMESADGVSGGVRVGGTVTGLWSVPVLDLSAELDPIDLAILPKLFPKIDRATGKLDGNLKVEGQLRALRVDGELHARADEIVGHDLPTAFTDVKIDVAATSQDITVRGNAKFAGGTLSIKGGIPLRENLSFGALDVGIVATGIHIVPMEGISTTFDADLTVTLDPNATTTNGDATAALPHVSGVVTIASFEYTRPVNLTTDLSSIGKGKRTVIETYDPSLDAIVFDGLRIRARSPLKIKNNLVDLDLAIDSDALTLNGTNQRPGLRGALKTLPGGRFQFRSNDFEIRQGLIRFEDPTRIAPNVDVFAVTEYRRYNDTPAATAGAASSSATGTGTTAAGGTLWRITLHAYGDADNLKLDMTSEPSLAQEDIVLLLTVGMTRAELDQLQASSLGASIALSYLGTASGADRAVKDAVPVIDDFRFGSGVTRYGQSDPQVTIGKRLTGAVRATITTGLSQDRELRSNIEWRLTQRLSALWSYDNITDVSSSAIGNLGMDLRWRLEFE